ncbi:thrombospondin type 3 repeat-containing protein [Luteolibacter luteus]|uniref:Uncharacterized protein n=1 Tax=Luteolibacter luteus TaxID=2728835 RepID=A0A858RDS3_9BACT|nr:thrombospondin type 3 repeat-containing protein [Luteolibacter luteus]QJE94470.1 hypothetical protein HHL09_01255 [Luteolibacter luteus]
MSEMTSAWYLGRSVVDAIDPDLQGWVDDLSVIPVSDHYLEWAKAKGLTAEQHGPAVDADGDGESNQVEYALGSDPLDATSKPPVITIQPSLSGNLGGRSVMVPFLPPHVSGKLESSVDLVSWQDYPATLRHFRIIPGVLWPGQITDTQTHQAIPLGPLDTAYYRIQFEDIVLEE